MPSLKKLNTDAGVVSVPDTQWPYMQFIACISTAQVEKPNVPKPGRDVPFVKLSSYEIFADTTPGSDQRNLPVYWVKAWDPEALWGVVQFALADDPNTVVLVDAQMSIGYRKTSWYGTTREAAVFVREQLDRLIESARQ